MYSYRLCSVLATAFLLCGPAAGQLQDLPFGANIGGNPNDIAVRGDFAYVARGQRFAVYDISDLANPEEISTLFFNGSAQSVIPLDSIVYLGTQSGIRIIDVTDPFNPETINNIETTSNRTNFMYLEGETLFASEDGGLRILDISDPFAPEEISITTFPTNGTGLDKEGNLLAVAGYTLGTDLVDVTDPANPSVVATIPNSEIGPNALPFRVDLVGTKLYIAASGGGFAVYDVSDPSNPSLEATVGTGALGGGAHSVLIDNDVAFVPIESGGMVALDISSPASPVHISTLQPIGGSMLVLAERNDTLYVSGSDGFRTVDATNPAMLSEFGHDSHFSQGYDLEILGGFAYVASGGGPALAIVDISDPAAPEMVGRYSTTAVSWSWSVDVAGDLAYLAYGSNGLRIVDVSDPTTPVEVGSAATPGAADYVDVDGTVAYVADDVAGLMTIDVGTPSAPVVVGQLGLSGVINALEFHDGIVYVAADTAGLHVVDVEDSASPTLITTINTPGLATDLVVSGDQLLLADTTTARTYDLTDPRNPVLLGFVQAGAGANLVTVASSEDRNFAGGIPGLFSAGADDPSNPTVTGFYQVYEFPFRKLVVRDQAYFVTENGGLFIVRVPPPAPDLDPVPPFINSDGITITGTTVPGSFVTLGGGTEPEFQQLDAGVDTFGIPVGLRQAAVNTLSVTTMNEFGLVSLPAIATVVEGDAFPSTIETVAALTISPDAAPDVPLNGSLPFTCEATFSDSSTADVTEFVQWEEIANGELITEGGLYVNTEAGAAQVRAFVAGVFSNVVTVSDD